MNSEKKIKTTDEWFPLRSRCTATGNGSHRSSIYVVDGWVDKTARLL